MTTMEPVDRSAVRANLRKKIGAYEAWRKEVLNEDWDPRPE